MPATPAKAKKPQDHKPKSSFGKRNTFPLETPSGNTIEVIRPGLQGLIKMGILHSMDGLTGIVQGTTIKKAEGQTVVDPEKILKNSGQMEEMFDILDKIAVAVVVEPKLFYPVVTQEMIDADEGLEDQIEHFKQEDLNRNLTDEERDPELAYVDYVGEEDKTFIMSFVMGGSADLVEFRKATAQTLGSIPDGQAAPVAAE